MSQALTIRRIERRAPNELLLDGAAWASLHVGDVVRIEDRRGDCTFAEVAVGASDRPLLVCRHVVPSLLGLRFYLVRQERVGAAS